MSQTMGGGGGEAAGFPRVSGDEPAFGVYAVLYAGFSPRERG